MNNDPEDRQARELMRRQTEHDTRPENNGQIAELKAEIAALRAEVAASRTLTINGVNGITVSGSGSAWTISLDPINFTGSGVCDGEGGVTLSINSSQ